MTGCDAHSTDGTDQDDYALYECRCGASIKFKKDEFGKLRWLISRFGYKNIDSAITDIRTCCKRPQYTEITAKRTLHAEIEQ